MKVGSRIEVITGSLAYAPAASAVPVAPAAPDPAIAPPFKKAAAAAIPKRPAIHGIAIPQIAPVDSPLLLFFVTGVKIVLFLLDVGTALF